MSARPSVNRFVLSGRVAEGNMTGQVQRLFQIERETDQTPFRRMDFALDSLQGLISSTQRLRHSSRRVSVAIIECAALSAMPCSVLVVLGKMANSWAEIR
jgi:hypothetical protein